MLSFAEKVPVEITKSNLNGTRCSLAQHPFIKQFYFSYNDSYSYSSSYYYYYNYNSHTS